MNNSMRTPSSLAPCPITVPFFRLPLLAILAGVLNGCGAGPVLDLSFQNRGRLLEQPDGSPSQIGPTAIGDNGLMVRPDFNRDGILDARDDSAARSADGQFSLRNGGAFFLANVDDDDRDGKSDGSDRVVNGAMDEDDLARFEIILSPELQKGVQSVRVDVTQGYGFIHLFAVNEKGFQFFDPVDDVLPAASKLSMALEGWRFAGKDSLIVRVLSRLR